MATVIERRKTRNDENGRARDGDGRILACEIGLRAFLDGGCNFLHARTSRARRKQRAGRQRAIHDGKGAASDNDPKNLVHGVRILDMRVGRICPAFRMPTGNTEWNLKVNASPPA